MTTKNHDNAQYEQKDSQWFPVIPHYLDVDPMKLVHQSDASSPQMAKDFLCATTVQKAWKENIMKRQGKVVPRLLSC